ncbi:MAG: ABC transporter permease, partial [Advenella sp.]
MNAILSGWRSSRLAQNYSLWAGLALFIFLILVTYVVPAVFKIDTSEINFDSSLQGPTLQYLFGTDDLGRPVFWRAIEALKTDLEIVAVCVLIPFVTGSLIGLVSGYVGGWFDTLIMRIVDIVWAFPFYVLVIAIVGSLGPSTQNMYLAFTLVVWISFARIVRGEVLLVKTTEYVQSARVMGYSHLRILFLHILPNVITPAIVF